LLSICSFRQIIVCDVFVKVEFFFRKWFDWFSNLDSWQFWDFWIIFVW
jgi:hypothetical protein